jgi:DNA-binding LytR/AlgR family response regulator
MAIKGYEVEAFDFLVKPVNNESFLLKIERALSRITSKLGESVFIKCKGEIITLLLDSIKYIESDAHYVIYHSLDGDFKEYATLKETEKKISSPYFEKCNQCYLVNLKHVKKFIDNDVVVGTDKLNMSRHAKKSFINKYTKYISGDLL